MNTPWYTSSREAYVAIANDISLQLEKSYRESFDIFYDIVSLTVWNSPKELAQAWIRRVTPEAWKFLEDHPRESIEVQRSKESVRKWLITSICMGLGKIFMNPTLLQKISTRLLIRNILAHDLPSHDQDRVISAELMTTLRLWKSLQNTLTIYDIIRDDQPLLEMPFFALDPNGVMNCQILVEGHIAPILGLPEAVITHGIWEKHVLREGIDHVSLQNTSHIILPENALMRHEAQIDPKNKAQVLRTAVINGLGWIPVFKKWGFGNKPSKVAPEWNIKPSLT